MFTWKMAVKTERERERERERFDTLGWVTGRASDPKNFFAPGIHKSYSLEDLRRNQPNLE